VQIFFVDTFACARKRQRPLKLLGSAKSVDALKVLRAFLKRCLPLSATPSRARYQLFEIAPVGKAFASHFLTFSFSGNSLRPKTRGGHPSIGFASVTFGQSERRLKKGKMHAGH
jgi:hypothetical protein